MYFNNPPHSGSENVEQATRPSESEFSVVSFFSGCGGLDLGFKGNFTYRDETFEKLPFNILAAYDKDAKSIETYNSYFADQHGSVTELDEAIAREAPAADVLIGGFPCQDFAACGPRVGLSSDRGRLYLTLVSYMKAHRPKVVVAENVIHLERMNGGATVEKIHADLEAAGYRFQRWQTYAPDFGVPQRRKRVFFIGVRDDLVGNPVEPKKLFVANPRSIEWAIDDLVGIDDESVANQSQYFRAAKAPTGHGQGDETNLRDKPAYTIRANAKSRVQFHYSLDRRLTVRECARLQTFPDDFVFRCSPTTSIMQIGNAVPPVLAHQVARSIISFLEDTYVSND